MTSAWNMVRDPFCDTIQTSLVDIIIIEDDPYYFLQEGVYVPKAGRTQLFSDSDSDQKFIASLAPSYLKHVQFARHYFADYV